MDHVYLFFWLNILTISNIGGLFVFLHAFNDLHYLYTLPFIKPIDLLTECFRVLHEELVFRVGIPMVLTESGLPCVWLISSLIFAVSHLTNCWFTGQIRVHVWQTMFTFLLGLIAYGSGSFSMGVLYHTYYNIVGIVLVTISKQWLPYESFHLESKHQIDSCNCEFSSFIIERSSSVINQEEYNQLPRQYQKISNQIHHQMTRQLEEVECERMIKLECNFNIK